MSGADRQGQGSWEKFFLLHEEGSSLLELALLLPLFFLMMVGTADFGRAYYLSIEVSHAANAGAEYGSQNPSDTSGMKAVAVADAADVPGFSTSNVTVTTGCECSDGTSASTNCTTTPSCSANAVTFVQVSTSFSYTSMLPYPGIPSPLTLQGFARMRAPY
jgi:Flp pilus assembly protein TadG